MGERREAKSAILEIVFEQGLTAGWCDASCCHLCSRFGGWECLCLHPPQWASCGRGSVLRPSLLVRPPHPLTSAQWAGGAEALPAHWLRKKGLEGHAVPSPAPTPLGPWQRVALPVPQQPKSVTHFQLVFLKEPKNMIPVSFRPRGFLRVHKSVRSASRICATYISFTVF